MYEKSLYVKSTNIFGEPTAQMKYISGFQKMLCLDYESFNIEIVEIHNY